MTIRQAILLAADSIEQNPELFSFGRINIPDGCGSPGCALGWVGFHLGLTKTHLSEIEVPPLLGLPAFNTLFDGSAGYSIFYSRLESFESDWARDASKCVFALRVYANKYHPSESAIPDSVMALFKQKVAA